MCVRERKRERHEGREYNGKRKEIKMQGKRTVSIINGFEWIFTILKRTLQKFKAQKNKKSPEYSLEGLMLKLKL